MKILQFVQGYDPAVGGTEYLIKNVAERLVKNFGDEVEVITTNAYNCEAFNTFGQKLMPPGVEVINGVTVKRLKVFNRLAPVLNGGQRLLYRWRLPFNHWARNLYSGPLLPGVLREILKADADVVAASSFPLLHMHYAGAVKRFKKIPLVLQGGLHPHDDWGFNRKSIFKAIRRADAYIAYTRFERDYLLTKGIDAEKIRVVGLGTDPLPFAEADGRAVKAKYNLDGGPVVMFLGQQGGHKGIDSLLRAMPLVWRRRPRTRLVIAGAPTNYSPHIHNMINQLPAADRDKITVIDGFSEAEKPQLLAAADIFASPSGHESFGITYLEAWAAGKPVIGCKGGAVATLISDNEDGLLVGYGDYGELAGAVLELLSDPELCRRLAANGYQKVIKNYTWDIVAAEFRRVFQEVMG